MKPKHSPFHSIRLVFAGLTVASISQIAHAQLTWDNAGSSNNWSTAAGNENWNGAVVWANGQSAIFGATPEAVSVTTAVTVDDITFNGSWTVSNGAGSINLTTDGNSNITVGTGFNTTIAETLGGTNAVTKLGLGTLSLIGTGLPNTFSGGLTISAGLIAFNNNTALGGAAGTAGAINLNGGMLQPTMTTNSSITNTHVITVGAGGGTINVANTSTATPTFNMGAASNLTGAGALTVSGDGTLVHGAGADVLVLGSANAGYTGAVTIQDGGILEYANAGAVGAGATFIVGNNGELSAANTTNSSAITLNAGSTLAFQNGNNGLFSGPIALNGDASIRMRDWYVGSTRSGMISNTITGAHTLSVNSGVGLDLGTGGTLTLAGFDAKASSADIVLNSTSLAINSGSGTAAASVNRGNSLTINTGNLNVTGVVGQNTNDVFGTLNLGNGSAGNLQGYSTWTLSPNGATNTTLTFTNLGTRTAGSWVAIAGTIGATPGAGTGNIFFTNAPSGANLIGSGGSLASGTASVIPWLRDQGGGNIYGYDATVGVAPITTVNVNPNSATAGQNINWNAASTLTADRSINSIQAAFSGINLGGFTLTVASGVITADNSTFSNGTLDFGSAEGQLSVHQARQLNLDLSITGSGGLTFVGFRTNSGNAGRIRLGGTNTFTGVANFFGYGAATAEVYLTNSLALQNATVNHVAGRGYGLIFGNGGTSGQTAYTFGALTGNANLNLANNNTVAAAVALTLGSPGSADTASTVNIYGGVLNNTVAGGSIIKEGVATQVFSGTNTYTGTTAVNAGKLLVSGSIGSSAVTVSNTGTVLASGATGTIGNTLTINNGAILAAGDAGSAGTATVTGATTFNNGSIFSWDVSANGASYDKLVSASLAGEVTPGDAVLRIVVADSNFTEGFWSSGTKTWNDIFTTDGSTAIANWANLFNLSVVDSTFNSITPVNGSFSFTGSTLTWSAVPEPTSAFAGLLIGAGLLRRRRKN